MMLDASPGRGLGGVTFIPSLEGRRRLAFLSRTQILTKLEIRTKNGALPPETGQTCAGAGGRQKTLAFGCVLIVFVSF